MGVTVDLTNFTGRFKTLKTRLRRMPTELLKTAGKIFKKSGRYHSPYITGRLKGSWRVKSLGGRKIAVGPTVIYGRRVNRVGRSAGYVQRGADAVSRSLVRDAMNARAKEIVERGV